MTRQQRRAAARRSTKGQPEHKRWQPEKIETAEELAERRRRRAEAYKAILMLGTMAIKQ